MTEKLQPRSLIFEIHIRLQARDFTFSLKKAIGWLGSLALIAFRAIRYFHRDGA